MALPRLLSSPRFVRLGIRVDTAPEWIWLALFALALWPTWWWMGRRLNDGSDDPLGLIALAALAVLVWRHRHGLRPAPRLAWLALGLLLAVMATLGTLVGAPPLACGLAAVLAVAAALAAWLPRAVPTLPVTTLAVLALPLLASLQFYAGYPLRVVTAEASHWLLSAFFKVERAGASLRVDGLLVLIDAPCSGVQMAWLGYFTAAVSALWVGRGNGSFLRRLPGVGALVLAGNVLRNTVLVAFAGAGAALPRWAHEGVGLAVLAGVSVAIAALMAGRTPHAHRPR